MDHLVNEKHGLGNKAHDVRLAQDILSLSEIEILADGLVKGEKDMQLNSKVVLEFLRHVGYLWGKNLNARNVEEKLTLTGKLNSAQFEQTMDYLKPLFRKLKCV